MGFVSSVRNYHYDYSDNWERENLKNKYNISWTKDYKNLNNMLSFKGLECNKLIDENNIRYLVFSLTNTKYNLSGIKGGDQQPQLHNHGNMRDIFYSVSLILITSGIKDENKKRLYKIIISKLQENYSLIKEGGQLDIYYVASSELEANVKESYRDEDEDEDVGGKGKLSNYTDIYPDKKLIPSISEVITLNNVINNKLTVNIYVFTCETFFRKYLNSNNVFSPYTNINRNNSKLWAFPILIIEEMTLSTITYLFKERKLNFHGMSNTRWHKLSPLKKNLSNFLYITDLDDTIHKTQLIYIDKIYTNNKIDPDLHKNIYNIQKCNDRNYILLKKDIITIKNSIQDLSDTNTNTYTNIEIKKIKELKLKRLEYLNNNLLNISEHYLSPKVIIFLLRNQNFSLEIEKLNF